jgi:glycosyltransferase involved in cell wall biosynthesis
MRILMIGWELPPHNSGGLGVACMGLARALTDKGAKVTFVLPKKTNVKSDFMDIVFADIKEVEKLTMVYTTSELSVEQLWIDEPMPDFVAAAVAYGNKISQIAKKLNADIIHSHDWLTSPAALAAKKVLGKPTVAHVHSTEFDRTGGNYPNKFVYDIEKKGLINSDRIISVSQYTKNLIVRNYGINSAKIDVVHNGVDEFKKRDLPPVLFELKRLGYKVVLYLGRITLQKGPDYFVYSAKKVLEYQPKTLFVVVGDGDMQNFMMDEAARLGIMNNFLFTGFLRGEEKDRVWQNADLYVMPSVSEPFGITALESIANGTPVLISYQSGVSEVIKNALKVDFWDVDEMTNKIVSVLRHPTLKQVLNIESGKELPNVNWAVAADKCLGIYESMIY